MEPEKISPEDILAEEGGWILYVSPSDGQLSFAATDKDADPADCPAGLLLDKAKEAGKL
jgi:hypothetical protein